MYCLGIDMGYASVKIALTDRQGRILHQAYRLHQGHPRAVLRQVVTELSTDYDVSAIAFGALTGSGALHPGHQAGIPTVNEVTALVAGARAVSPSARSIIEIGGQSAKYITGLNTNGSSGIKVAMNSSCSAGTGSFLEEQVSRLRLKLEDYSLLSSRAKSIPRIAGRCSVFAKTDIIHHQQEGVPAADILMGLAYALIRNYRVAVMRKLPQENPILLAGGVAHNQAILTALKDILDLEACDLIVQDQVDVLGAVGAALIGGRQQLEFDLTRCLAGLEQADVPDRENGTPPPKLAAFGLDDHSGKHRIPILDHREEPVAVYLGLDVGSTSTNLVLSDRDDRILAFRYLRTLGDPVKAVRTGLEALKRQFNGRIKVLGACTTGSGRYMTGRLIGADLIKDEITAQARAAVKIDPKVDTVFEIGGQDAKFISLKDGAVVDFQMNKICAAGTGSFIEEQAKKFDIKLSDIGPMALAADHPINLGERCTVFMETSIASHLGRGANMEDITAGLCYAVVKNYLNRVVGRKTIGSRILLQGGIAYNQGVVNAFRSLTGRNMVVPPFFSVTGAYGAAILAREAMAGKPSAFKGFDLESDPSAMEGRVRALEKPAPPSSFNQSVEKLIFEGYTGQIDPQKETVGIPRALFTYGMFSMFYTIFTELGFNVLLSEPTSEKTIALGQAYSLDETCYPVKLINGHVAELVNRKVDYIFFPDLYTVDHPGSPSRQNYGCAYMQLAFKMVNQAMDLDSRGIRLLSPTIASNLGKAFMMNSFADLGKRLGKSQEETVEALQKGVKAFHDFEARIARAGRAALADLDPHRKAFVLISKIYGVADPVLNMGIPDRLTAMGYQVLPFYYLPEGDLSQTHPNMYWPFGQHILEPAQLVREHSNLYGILLTHHGCGPDSVMTHYFREAMQGKPYLHIEVDEHSSGVGVATRLEAFVNSLQNQPAVSVADPAAGQTRLRSEIETITTDTAGLKPGTRLYLPFLYPYADIAAALIEATMGGRAAVLPVTNRDSADLGRTFTLVEEYFSLTALLGDVVTQCQSLQNGDQAAFLVPKNEGAEVDGQYSRLLRAKLDEAGYERVSIVSPYLEDLLDVPSSQGRTLFWGLLAGDLVRLTPAEHRQARLEQVLEMIRDQRLTLGALTDMARDIRQEIHSRSWLKQLLIVGEPMVIYNDYLNDYLFETLASQGYRILYAPLSEAMWLFWRDHVVQNGQLPNKINIINQLAREIRQVHERLNLESHFEKDVSALAVSADRSMGYYSGAFGRFRAAKVRLADERMVDGVITATSTYENTGISLNVLQKSFATPSSKPVLNLTFDGNRSQNDVIRCEAFLQYL